MIEWEVGDGHLRVVDADNAEVSVRGEAFAVDGPGPDVPRPVDETVEATARALEFPHAVVYAFSLDREESYRLEASGDPLTLPAGRYLLDVDAEIKIYVQFSGRALVRATGDYERVVVTFPERRRLVMGFRSRHEFPARTITVPYTPQGVATAVTHLSSAHKTSSPDRSYPTLRGHPPLVREGPAPSIPEDVREAASDVGIELVLPDAIEPLFVTAPLAYYLQADVRVSDRRTPALRLPDRGVEHTLSAMPTLERDVERLLRTVFFLDCLVRNAGPYRVDLAESNMLDALDLDAPTLYEADPATRLEAYLGVPYGAVEHRLPEWHLTTYVEPKPSRVETLPFLLDRMSLVSAPRSSELEGKELVERSLEDFYRASPGAGKVASVDIVKPELRSGVVHGWLADGVPIDVFKSTPAAYYNRLDHLRRETDTTSVCIVLNDPDMAGEHERVEEIYRERSEDLAIDVTVEEALDTASLARTFESDRDFVHYIGHCETGGLECPDGYLSTSSLDRSNVQTFFLNACGSFYEGMTLIEKGSVAGAITFTQVLNEHAIKVGSTFAKLLMHGFSIERAMRLARRRIMMGKDYAVVGDGTHTLTQGDQLTPTTATVEPLDDGRYLLSLDCYSTQRTGRYYVPHVGANERAYLCGTESNFTVETDELLDFLEGAASPVIYDGDVYWSGDLSELLAS